MQVRNGNQYSGGCQSASFPESPVFFSIATACWRPKGVNRRLHHYLTAFPLDFCFPIYAPSLGPLHQELLQSTPLESRGRQIPLKQLAPHGTSQQGGPLMRPSVPFPSCPKELALLCYKIQREVAASNGSCNEMCFDLFFI